MTVISKFPGGGVPAVFKSAGVLTPATPRRRRPWVAVNCRGLGQELNEVVVDSFVFQNEIRY